MVDLLAVQLALRARMLALSVATTGSTALSATATGYARAAGSFATDNFAVGMEILASGFTIAANNGYSVITSVTATALGISGGRTAESAGGNETLTAGLPERRAFDNIELVPVSGRLYVKEEFVPATHSLFSGPAEGGEAEETGLYVIKWYGLSGTGVTAITKSVGALKALFAPGTKFAAGSHFVRVREDTATQGGQLLPQDGGWTACVLKIPWRAFSLNTIAA